MNPDPDDLPKILDKIAKGLSDTPHPVASDQTRKNGG
jgi:hypothetical protein